MACHRLNDAGDAQVGPDLNVPYNPPNTSPRLPQALYPRPAEPAHWPQAKMPAFAPAVLPDGELDQLVAYLKHMAKRKQPI
ncbi:cytochrome c [Pseudomonas sp. PCH446]